MVKMEWRWKEDGEERKIVSVNCDDDMPMMIIIIRGPTTTIRRYSPYVGMDVGGNAPGAR